MNYSINKLNMLVLTGLSGILCNLSIFAQDSLHLPESKGLLIKQEGYYVDYDTIRHTAYWVAYELTTEELIKNFDRKTGFTQCKELKHRISSDDIKESVDGYQKGHLKPARDSQSTEEERYDANEMVNIAPQSGMLNTGLWKDLEKACRDLVEEHSSAYIICGSSLESIDTLDAGIMVPKSFWKTVLIRTEDSLWAHTYIITNNLNEYEQLNNYCISIDSLESIIKLDLFEKLETNSTFSESNITCLPADN